MTRQSIPTIRLKPLTITALLVLLLSNYGLAQAGRKAVATVLLPIHLDSLFKADQYKFGNSIPRFALPYLEFYHGVQLAADSLKAEGIAAEINVVDSRKWGSVQVAMADPEVQKAQILIGVAQSTPELKAMADFAKGRKIPFVSATYPNDGGIRDNAGMLLVNTTLRSHCIALYKFLQSNHSLDNLVLVTRKGMVETYIKNWLTEAGQATNGYKLKWKEVVLTDSFNINQVKPLLDSTRQNTILAATMDPAFGQRLVKTISPLTTSYQSTVVGMPTWDEIDFRRTEFKGVNVVFSTPFVSMTANVDIYNAISRKYAATQNSKPSDMVMRGFELTYRFVKSMWLWPDQDEFARHLNDKQVKVFADFNFQAVSDRDSDTVNYYENRKLYFVKKLDGAIKGVY